MGKLADLFDRDMAIRGLTEGSRYGPSYLYAILMDDPIRLGDG